MIGALIAKRIAKQKFDARNRGDIDAFLDGWTDETTYIFPGHSEFGGTFRGMATIRDWFTRFRRQFAEIRFELKDVFVSNIWAMGANNNLAVHWVVHLKNHDGQQVEGPGVTVVHIREGQTTFVQDFIFDLNSGFFQADFQPI